MPKGQQPRPELVEGNAARADVRQALPSLQLLADGVGTCRRAGTGTVKPGLEPGGDNASAPRGGLHVRGGHEERRGAAAGRRPGSDTGPGPEVAGRASAQVRQTAGSLRQSGPRRLGCPRLGLRLGSTPRTPTSISYGRRRRRSTSIRLGRFFQRKLDVPWVAELRDSVWRSSVMVVRGKGTKGSAPSEEGDAARPPAARSRCRYPRHRPGGSGRCRPRPATAAGRPKRLRRDGMG